MKHGKADVRITVYIMSHNYGRYLQDAIESVLRQSIDGWELLLIDDNSKDNTADVMNLYKGDRRIRIFRTGGIGLPAVANFVMKNSKGEYILRVDADDVVDENMLLVLGNYLDRNTDTAMVFPDYFLMDDGGGIIGQERRQPIYHSNHLLDMPANGACTMIRKSILSRVGGYREDLKAQDGFDIWSRISKNYKCSNVNLPLFYYRRHGANITEDVIRVVNARREIKRNISIKQVNRFRPITAVIPCRKNYDIYPDLWNRKIGSGTLLDRAIETCLASSLFDNIVVASDTLDVKDAISVYRDSRLKYVERSARSTLISTPIASTLENVVTKLRLNRKGIINLLYLQAPMTTTSTLEEAVNTMVMNEADSAVAVKEVNFPVYKRMPHGLTPVNSQGSIKSDFDIVYQETRTSIATRCLNLKSGSLTGSKIAYFVIPNEESFFIHSRRDLELVKILMKEKGV